MTLPKSIAAIRFFFIWLPILFAESTFAQAGKDGVKVINAVNSIVNDYTTLLTDVNSGANSILVSSNSLNVGFASPLSSGDLILIIQVQGATIDVPDNSSYGGIISYQNSGNYEFEEVASVSGANTINTTCPLTNNYTASGKVVVVRVPRYSSLTINGGASLTCPAWNGASGGIIAIDINGTTLINGGATIDANGKGFRGGSLLYNNSTYGVGNDRWPGNSYGAEKGESIAGSVAEYDLLGGRYCKGAPANGGGGGNAHNAGGGGGANAGNISTYNGKGNPDISNASWATAWNLEAAGFSSSISSGGGKGGYTFSSSNQNALSIGPSNAAWGGDARAEQGGRGGRPLDYSTGKIFMGGGGGAGDENNSKGGAGGRGGGIVILNTTASISGSGQILCSGANGASTTSSDGTDGAGGGGGGGTVWINASGMISGITINANGGNGGSQSVLSFTTETEGPGGGGGGGYIAVSGGAIMRNTNGGTNGTTNSLSLSEFPPNGATKGGAGINNASINSFRVITLPVNICSSSAVSLTFTTSGTLPAGITFSWYDQSAGGSVLGTGTSFITPVLTASKTYYIGSCPGFSRTPIQVNVSNGLVATISATTGCSVNPVSFNSTATAGVNSWLWDFGDGTGTATVQNPSYTYANGGTYNVTLTISNGTCSTSFTQSIVVDYAPLANFTSNANVCGPLTVQFTNNSTNANSYQWNFGDGSPAVTSVSPSHVYSTAGTYTVTLNAYGTGCTASKVVVISLAPSPRASFTANNTVCQNDTVHFTNQSNGNGSAITSLNWDFGDGSPVSSATNPFHVYPGIGTFIVRLTVNTSSCTDDTTINVVVSTAPVVNFSAAVVSGCPPLNVGFTNSTTGSPLYIWNFGDGSPVSSQTSPTHNYTSPGLYSVTLIATQGSCSDTLRKNNFIQVDNKPTSSFSASSVCSGDSTRFNNLSIGNGSPITSYSWTFGDGGSATGNSPSHLYSASGTYSVQLTANTATCSDDTTISVNVIPIPQASFSSNTTSVCDSATIQFNNSTTGANTYSWLFGDGGTSSSSSPIHHYSAPGLYTVSLTATSNGGCNSTRVNVNMINIHSSPSAAFTTSSSSICTNACISFNSTSSSGVNSWLWNFSGASTATATTQNPGNICYPSSGNYNVTLQVSNSFCNGTHTENAFIHVANCSSFPKADFISSDTNLCGSTCVDFVDLSTNAITWLWLFPGGNPASSTSENPTHVCYANQGTYDVTLVAGNTTGYDTIVYTNFIQVSPAPAIPVVSINGSALQSTPAAQYQWYLNNVPLSGSIGQNHVALLSGNYSVVVTDINGCTSSSSQSYVSILGIESPENNLLFNCYPNPVDDILAVVLQSTKPQKIKLTFFNAIGSRLFYDDLMMTSNEQSFKFNLKEFTPGVYFIQVESGEYKKILSIIRQ